MYREYSSVSVVATGTGAGGGWGTEFTADTIPMTMGYALLRRRKIYEEA